jgi:hypothetical protein
VQQFLGNPAQVQKQLIWLQLHQRHQRCHQKFRKTCQAANFETETKGPYSFKSSAT